MNATEGSSEPTPSRGVLAGLAVLFAGGGCAALIYEIVWFQLLQLAIGSTAVSLGILLATYMGGLCLGSLLAPRLVSTRWNPVSAYALLEAGIGILGIAALWIVPSLARVYGAAGGGAGVTGFLLRGAIGGICLLPPTLLMGATLPVLSRWVQATPRGVSWIGILYGANIAGAVFGCLAAGFYLLRVHDLHVATYTAAALNGLVALLAAGLASECGFRISGCQSRVRQVMRTLGHSAAGTPQFTSPSRCLGLPPSAPKWFGRDYWRCSSGGRFTPSRSFWLFSSSDWEPAAPWERCGFAPGIGRDGVWRCVRRS